MNAQNHCTYNCTQRRKCCFGDFSRKCAFYTKILSLGIIKVGANPPPSHSTTDSSFDPKCVAYFCGAVFADTDQIPPPTDFEYPALMKERAKKKALRFIERKMERSFPTTYTHRTFDWNYLTDPHNRSDIQRLDAQYWRTNADPTERYVLSAVNSSKYRLYAGNSGFKILYLAGDWTDNKVLNAGCMEAAIISGLQASRAVCGFLKKIEGETGSITGG